MSDVEILGFTPELAPHFERLNVEWIAQRFKLEGVDQRVLQHPQSEVIDHGGDILFARLDGQIVGVVALKHQPAQGLGVFELTKMGVTGGMQGKGIGRQLMMACIERYRALGGTMLYLETHDSLKPAIHLYETVGFEHTPRPRPSIYARSNVYMVLQEG